ncbi:MAG: YHYH protein [Bacteroidia bacterium]|nr:YHYH protein [Bacteroidia bacterium]
MKINISTIHKNIFTAALLIFSVQAFTQTNPAITSWLQNTSIKGRHYVSGNSTPITDTYTANVQSVQYSSNFSYVSTQGIPTYVTGPFLDGNPNQAGNQNAIFKFPLNPVQNTGTLASTTGGNIGVFINGVALFDYRDGVSWKNSTSSLCGGPIQPPCMGDGVWNRDAIVGERLGFDCSKGHPAGTNYHHHQSPSAFKLDLNVISTVCNLYDADGLYAIDSTVHSPLIGFAYDGFPIYGAYGFKNVDGTGGIVRMKSSFTLRNITTRTTYYTSTATVTPGPAVSTTYPLGYFREDYQYNATSAATPDYLDIHNGRFCVTPEYPNGIYCYFATVTSNWNSAYPYVVGPTFYGTKVATKVTSITEATTTYTQSSATGLANTVLNDIKVNIFPNPASDLIAVQINDLVKENYDVILYDITGKIVEKKTLYQGSTIVYFDTKTLYNGIYTITLYNSEGKSYSKKISISK